ncbi:LysR family substrate-binding domain-containing protein [Streptomyces sp. NPDC058470]|uniref:LysR family substrate-binding domain-containing protein n=1 Tax=Streptomyces sp. NPDC058470 TaxID=3346515 RepID=UPI00365DE616
MPGITVTGAVRAFSARHPELSVQVVRTSWGGQVQGVQEGVLDVSFVRLPVDHRGLELRPLFREPRVAVLPADHRLAGEESIVIADLAAERLLQDPDAVPEWRDRQGRAGRPSRLRRPPGRAAGDHRRHPEELHQYAAEETGPADTGPGVRTGPELRSALIGVERNALIRLRNQRCHRRLRPAPASFGPGKRGNQDRAGPACRRRPGGLNTGRRHGRSTRQGARGVRDPPT